MIPSKVLKQVSNIIIEHTGSPERAILMLEELSELRGLNSTSKRVFEECLPILEKKGKSLEETEED